MGGKRASGFWELGLRSLGGMVVSGSRRGGLVTVRVQGFCEVCVYLVFPDALNHKP